MRSSTFHRSIAFVASAITLGSAQNLYANYNPTGAGCVDPKGFLSCYSTVAANAVTCQQFCDTTTPSKTGVVYTDCTLGCGGAWLAANIGCWIQGCWNQVYSCEYQIAAMAYFDGTDLVQNSNIPFYPPPDSASAGACSCNLGYVYGNITAISQNLICSDVAGTGNLEAVYTCECCAGSWAVSNSLAACPKSDLSIVGFADYLSKMQKLISPSSDHCAILNNNSDTCVTEYHYPFVATVYNPLELPPGEPGTEALSNTAGNAFTKFGASTFSLSLFPGFTTTITPAPFNAKAGAATGTVASTGGVVATGTNAAATAASTGKATGTGSSAAASGTAATTTKSSGSKTQMSLVLMGCILATYLGAGAL